MRSPSVWLLLLILAGGGFFFFRNFEIAGFDRLRVTPKGQAQSLTDAAAVPVKRTGESIRIASFNLKVLGNTKLEQPQVMEILARIVRNFDVVAVQEIRSQQDDILPRFVEVINAPGRHYDFVISRRLGRTRNKEQYGFLFDRASLEVDRTQSYVVEDRYDLLHRPPFVAWFRVRGPKAEDAFTFSLVNVHIDPDDVQQELLWMDNVMKGVRDDGREEDDVILLGDFNTDDRNLGELGELPGLVAAISGTPTNTLKTRQYDNILFLRHPTREFLGRVGVLDFMREYNLTQQEANHVSDHLPVWAEFHIYEGGQPGRVALQ